MTRKTSRRFTNYSKESDDQRFNEQMPQQQQQPNDNNNNNNNKVRDNDSTIADMAQGFIQAQAKMSDKGSNFNNLEIALLLQKCNDQLEEIRRSAQGNSNNNILGDQNNKNATMQKTSQQEQGGAVAQDNKQQVSGVASQDLQSLLATVLQGKNNNENSEMKPPTKQSNTNNTASGGNQQNMIAVQNVSQVLAQAQYELANELENSLKKLKQVISDSEKIANNISNLLGEEATKKS